MSQPIKTKIKVTNPPISDSSRTYLTQDVAVGATALSVVNKRGFFKADLGGINTYCYVLIGDYNQEKSEIARITLDDSENKVLVCSGLLNSHSSSEPITVIEYNKMRVYGGTVPGEAANILNTPIATVKIDSTQQFTEYIYEWKITDPGLQFTYFVTTYYNEALDQSSFFSEEIQVSTFNRRSVKRIVESAAIKALTKVDESPVSVLNWNNCIDIVQDGIDEILARKRKWSFFKVTANGNNTIANQPNIPKPSDCSAMEFLKVGKYKLDWISPMLYKQNTQNGGLSVTTGEPVQYTEINNEFYLYPTPAGSLAVIYDYWQYPAVLSQLGDTIPLQLSPVLIYYCGAQFAYIRGNDKRGDKLYAMYTKLLEQQCDEYSGPAQFGDAESMEQTNVLFMED